MAGVSDFAAWRLRRVPVYEPGAASSGAAADKLSSNEAPLGPAPAVRNAISAAAGSVNRYPEQLRATQLLAEHTGVPVNRLVLANGSDELCYLIASVFLGVNRVAVLGQPCYQIDATVSLLAGAALRPVPLLNGAHDLAAMADAARDAAVIWIPSPHNPTGAAVDPGEFEAFLEQVSDSCLVVLDEAYRSFTDPDSSPDSLTLLERYDNLLIQRTLSKDWALAGLRIGYAIASEPVAGALRRARAPFSVNSLALVALEAAVHEEAWRQMSVAQIRRERSLLEAELDRLGIPYYPSQANFVTARLDSTTAVPALQATGLVVRPGENLGVPGWVRISIGWAPQMAILREVLQRLAL